MSKKRTNIEKVELEKTKLRRIQEHTTKTMMPRETKLRDLTAHESTAKTQRIMELQARRTLGAARRERIRAEKELRAEKMRPFIAPFKAVGRALKPRPRKPLALGAKPRTSPLLSFSNSITKFGRKFGRGMTSEQFVFGVPKSLGTPGPKASPRQVRRPQRRIEDDLFGPPPRGM
jgi:hypothetical protein